MGVRFFRFFAAAFSCVWLLPGWAAAASFNSLSQGAWTLGDGSVAQSFQARYNYTSAGAACSMGAEEFYQGVAAASWPCLTQKTIHSNVAAINGAEAQRELWLFGASGSAAVSSAFKFFLPPGTVRLEFYIEAQLPTAMSYSLAFGRDPAENSASWAPPYFFSAQTGGNTLQWLVDGSTVTASSQPNPVAGDKIYISFDDYTLQNASGATQPLEDGGWVYVTKSGGGAYDVRAIVVNYYVDPSLYKPWYDNMTAQNRWVGGEPPDPYVGPGADFTLGVYPSTGSASPFAYGKSFTLAGKDSVGNSIPLSTCSGGESYLEKVAGNGSNGVATGEYLLTVKASPVADTAVTLSCSTGEATPRTAKATVQLAGSHFSLQLSQAYLGLGVTSIQVSDSGGQGLTSCATTNQADTGKLSFKLGATGFVVVSAGTLKPDHDSEIPISCVGSSGQAAAANVSYLVDRSKAVFSSELGNNSFLLWADTPYSLKNTQGNYYVVFEYPSGPGIIQWFWLRHSDLSPQTPDVIDPNTLQGGLVSYFGASKNLRDVSFDLSGYLPYLSQLPAESKLWVAFVPDGVPFQLIPSQVYVGQAWPKP